MPNVLLCQIQFARKILLSGHQPLRFHLWYFTKSVVHEYGADTFRMERVMVDSRQSPRFRKNSNDNNNDNNDNNILISQSIAITTNMQSV